MLERMGGGISQKAAQTIYDRLHAIFKQRGRISEREVGEVMQDYQRPDYRMEREMHRQLCEAFVQERDREAEATRESAIKHIKERKVSTTRWGRTSPRQRARGCRQTR